jgi:DNA-directed RNA polymerase specialized sigma24 family protein
VEATPRLLRTLKRSIGPHLSRHIDPEDILQDSLTALLEAPKSRSLETPSDLRRRVLAIARNKILMVARRDSLGLVVPSATPQDLEREVADPAPSDGFSSQAVLDGLDLEHRLSILLRDWLGMPWESIAVVLDRPSKNAVQLLHYRARKAARDHLTHQRLGR